MLATCTSAVLGTSLVQSMFGIEIGILTANLGTIVFVVTLSHLVYMTFNWQTPARQGKEDSHDLGANTLGAKAWGMTLPASFWSMVCASLEFGSLLLVSAKPLGEFGFGGGNGGGAGLRLPDVPGIPGLGIAEGNQSDGQRSRIPFGGAEVRVDVAGYRVGERRFEFRPDAVEHRPSLLDYFKRDKEPPVGLTYGTGTAARIR